MAGRQARHARCPFRHLSRFCASRCEESRKNLSLVREDREGRTLLLAAATGPQPASQFCILPVEQYEKLVSSS
ncbi:hypothetical protein EUGRSUZ_F00999 [Eucalyptus grandis]|uniref:Uncharacterized protein n=2 Tax=Eucalyptus grandis TaxID=71139 RepID=A0ACC3KCU9_EUCGR|nr:hypothetical protein EUGRSUZ_F00999 [Eucalyptus grandis]